jgi:hypothetical protein
MPLRGLHEIDLARADAAELVLLREVVTELITTQAEMLRVLRVMHDLAKAETIRGKSIWKMAETLCEKTIKAGEQAALVEDNPNIAEREKRWAKN